MTEGGDLGDQARNAGDLSGDIDHARPDPPSATDRPTGQAGGGGVTGQTVQGGRTGSGLGGGTAPGGPLDLGGDRH